MARSRAESVTSDLRIWFGRGIGFAAGVVLVGGLLLLAFAAGQVLLLIFVAILLASGLEPIVEALRTRLPIGRGVAILFVYVAFFLAVLALALVIVPVALDQAAGIRDGLPAFFERAREWAATIAPPAVAATLAEVIDEAEALTNPPPPDPEAVVRAGLTVAEAVAGLMTLLTIVFFWLVEHARLQRYLLAFLPARRRAGARDAWNDVESRLGRWIRGVLILMATMGVGTTVAYTLLGLPSPLLLGLIAALMEAVPIVGPLLGAIPALLVAATISPHLALAVAIVYAAVQFVEGNILVPLVMRNTIGLSPFVVLATVLVGAAAGGILGALLALPVVAAVLVILQRLQARGVPVAQDSATASADGRGTRVAGRELGTSAAQGTD